MSQDRLDRIERALETITRQHHEFDMDWTGKMGELTGKMELGFERLFGAVSTLAEQQIRFNDRQLAFEDRQSLFEEHQLAFDDRQSLFEEHQLAFDARLEKFDERQLELQAGLQALTALIDRFIRGQGGDGGQQTQQP